MVTATWGCGDMGTWRHQTKDKNRSAHDFSESVSRLLVMRTEVFVVRLLTKKQTEVIRLETD
jgi:hypothetical protein